MPLTRTRLGFLLLVAVACEHRAAPPTGPEAPAFQLVNNVELTELGSLGGAISLAHDVNDAGTVAGIGSVSGGEYRAFRWRPGEGMLSLGSLGGAFSRGAAINNLGVIAGTSRTASGASVGFLWTESDGMVAVAAEGLASLQAWGVNVMNVVVGDARQPSGRVFAYRWSGSAGLADLGPPGVSSSALGVNAFGQVVGSAALNPGEVFPRHATLWQPGGEVVDLGTVGGDISTAAGINDLGEIVGRSTTVPGQDQSDAVPVLWSVDRTPTVLPILQGNAFAAAGDINDLGIVVGSAYNDAVVDGEAFMWTQRDGLVRLPGLGGPIAVAQAISNVVGDRVLIVGAATPPGGGLMDLRAVLWTVDLLPPTPDETTEQVGDAIDNAEGVGTLSGGQAGALRAKLDAALRQLEKGNVAAARRLLEALLSQINAYVAAELLTPAEAQPLVAAVNQALESL